MEKRILFQPVLASENISMQDLYDISREMECAWEEGHPGEKLRCKFVPAGKQLSAKELLELFNAD